MANWTQAVLSGIGLYDQLDRYDDTNQYIQDELTDARTRAVEGSEFTPFTVTSRGGTASAGPGGSINYQMDPATQAQMDARNAQSNTFYNRASSDMGQNTQDVFQAMRAMQMPGEQRAQTELEQRLFAQGRGGMTTNQYGGSPEQLAMHKAIGENRNAAAVAAIEQGRMQQAQDAALGGQFQTAEYLPQAQLMNTMNQGLQTSQINQAGQLAGVNYDSNLRLGQIQAQVNSEQTRAGLMQQLFNTIGGTAAANNFDPIGDIGGAFGRWFGGLF
jgi:hypothetical protein